MHSLGTQTLERTGYVVSPAAVTADLYAALSDLVNTVDLELGTDTYPARKALELADKVLHACHGTCNGARLPIDPVSRLTPPHRDARGRACSYNGAVVSKTDVEKLQGHRR